MTITALRVDGMRCCCDTVTFAMGELLLFSPRSCSPHVPLKVVQAVAQAVLIYI